MLTSPPDEPVREESPREAPPGDDAGLGHVRGGSRAALRRRADVVVPRR